MIHIAIVDDDDTDAANTTSLIGRYYESDRSAYHITRFTDGDTFLDTYRAGFDVLFLDIEMPGIDGLETAHRLREIDDHVVLVFTTKMAQYAAIGYDVDAVGYLVKPIDYFGFAFKMRKVEDLVAKRQGVTIPLTVGTGTQFLSSHDVRYIEVLGHEVIYCTDTTAYKVWSSLKDAAALLEPVHLPHSNSKIVRSPALRPTTYCAMSATSRPVKPTIAKVRKPILTACSCVTSSVRK